MAYLEGLLKPESEAKVQSNGSGEERTVSLQSSQYSHLAAHNLL